MNISPRRIIKISKYLSYHLRHRRDLLGLELASEGWVEIEKLIAAAHKSNFSFSLSELKIVVEQSDKQRFAFDPTGKLIRANRGHSVAVDLKLKSSMPPEILDHGTSDRFIKTIPIEGLNKMKRHHVHLSADLDTATKVAQRRPKPLILEVAAGKMAESKIQFFLSANGVWLVDFVPPEYLKLRK